MEMDSDLFHRALMIAADDSLPGSNIEDRCVFALKLLLDMDEDEAAKVITILGSMLNYFIAADLAHGRSPYVKELVRTLFGCEITVTPSLTSNRLS